MIANNLNNFQRYNYKEKLTWITKVFPWFLAEKMFHDCLMDFLIYKNKLLLGDFHLCKQIKRNCSRNRKPNYPLHWNWFPIYYSSSNFVCMIKPIWAYQLASIPLETIRKPCFLIISGRGGEGGEERQSINSLKFVSYQNPNLEKIPQVV